MLKIGEFSKLAQVSVKALRHYGKLGLLPPAWIDRFSGYRYYAVDQLPRLNRILALKELGFSLEQIRQVLLSDLPLAELRGMMRIKRAELERQIQSEQARLAHVEMRLQQIEREGQLPAYEVVCKRVASQLVLGIRSTLPDIAAVEGRLGELYAYLRTHNVVPTSTFPALAVYYDAEYRDRKLDVEVAVQLPASRKLPLIAGGSIHTLPAVETMACSVHRGSSQTLNLAYNALLSWIEAHGYRVAGPNRDVYLRGPGSDLPVEEYLTEVQFPLQTQTSSVFIQTLKEKDLMEPKIVTKEAFKAVGMKYRGKNQNKEIPQMWDVLNARCPESGLVAKDQVAYGICREMDPDGVFEYLAGFEVEDASNVPEGMELWEVAEQRYAVFPTTLKDIGATYDYAFRTWLPQSGYQRGSGPDFEYYNDEFKFEDEQNAKLYIYIPVIK